MRKISLFIIFLLFSSLAYGHVELADPGLLPDHPFYFFKRFFENLDLFFTFDDSIKTEKLLKYSEIRIAEAEAMAFKGRSDLAQRVLEDYQSILDQASFLSEKVYREKNTSKILEIVANSTFIHLDILDEIEEILPEEASFGIKRAMNVSKRGHERALEVLSQNFPERSIELNIEFSKELVREITEKIREEEIEELDEIIEEYNEKLNKTRLFMQRAEILGKDVLRLVELVANATTLHLEVLNRTLFLVPEEAKFAIQRAMNVSKRGSEEAIERLKEINPLRARAFEERIEKILEKIEERVEERIEERMERIERMEEIIPEEEEMRAIEEVIQEIEQIEQMPALPTYP